MLSHTCQWLHADGNLSSGIVRWLIRLKDTSVEWSAGICFSRDLKKEQGKRFTVEISMLTYDILYISMLLFPNCLCHDCQFINKINLLSSPVNQSVRSWCCPGSSTHQPIPVQQQGSKCGRSRFVCVFPWMCSTYTTPPNQPTEWMQQKQIKLSCKD